MGGWFKHIARTVRRAVTHPVRTVARVIKNPAKAMLNPHIRKSAWYRTGVRPVINVGTNAGIGFLSGGPAGAFAAGGKSLLGEIMNGPHGFGGVKSVLGSMLAGGMAGASSGGGAFNDALSGGGSFTDAFNAGISTQFGSPVGDSLLGTIGNAFTGGNGLTGLLSNGTSILKSLGGLLGGGGGSGAQQPQQQYGNTVGGATLGGALINPYALTPAQQAAAQQVQMQYGAKTTNAHLQSQAALQQNASASAARMQAASNAFASATQQANQQFSSGQQTQQLQTQQNIAQLNAQAQLATAQTNASTKNPMLDNLGSILQGVAAYNASKAPTQQKPGIATVAQLDAAHNTLSQQAGGNYMSNVSSIANSPAYQQLIATKNADIQRNVLGTALPQLQRGLSQIGGFGGSYQQQRNGQIANSIAQNQTVADDAMLQQFATAQGNQSNAAATTITGNNQQITPPSGQIQSAALLSQLGSYLGSGGASQMLGSLGNVLGGGTAQGADTTGSSNILGDIMHGIGRVGSGIVNGIGTVGGWLGKGAKAIGGGIGNLGRALLGSAGSLWDAGKSAVGKIGGWLSGLFGGGNKNPPAYYDSPAVTGRLTTNFDFTPPPTTNWKTNFPSVGNTFMGQAF